MTFSRPDSEWVARAGAISTATLHEALSGKGTKRGHLPANVQAIGNSMRLCGPAFPVQCIGGSNINLHYAIYEAQPGDVIVAVTEQAIEFGYWGEVMAIAALARGIAGLVIEGGVRDADRMIALGFPVFSCGRCIKGTAKQQGGSLGEPVVFGETRVHPGDLVVGDGDGVVVLPIAEIQDTIRVGLERDEDETELFETLRAGGTTLERFGFPPR